VSSIRHWGTASLLALALASATPAAAQVVIGGDAPPPNVEVDNSVLDRLGGEQTLPDMFLNRRPPAPLAPLTAAPRPHVSVMATPLEPYKPRKVQAQHQPAEEPKQKIAKAKTKPEVKVVKAKPPAAPQVAELPNPEPAAPVAAAKPAEAPKPVQAPKVAAPVETPKPVEPPKVVQAPKTPVEPPKATAMAAPALPPVKVPVIVPKPAETKTADAKPVETKPEPKPFKVPPAISTAPPPPVPVVQAPTDPTPVKPPEPAPAAVPPMVVTGPPIAPPLSSGAEPTQQQARLTPAPVATGNGNYSIPFEPDGAILSDASRNAMVALSKRMTNDAALSVQLLAYAEGDEDNASKARRLSLSRALAVRSFLIDQGVHSTRIEVRALGNKVPDGPADRVDVLVQKR